ncbi:hypothetical protein Cni_G26580 [Canna indica]|uniref:DUF7392 domain-containing protein n=1 Tax=Canna indica TaxID=4628 RepID=A0AAQ3KZ89_9LILI|nr:hypothetical protein Cni_G26580 [Canna indica]
MPCFVPFDEEKVEISFLVFRPRGVFSDELIDAMKLFSFHAEDLGCLYSSVLKSMHGNLQIVWYGAWIRRSPENRQILKDALLSVLEEVSSLGALVHHAFVKAFFGETKESGKAAAKFSTGDTVFLSAMAASTPRQMADLSYAFVALHKSFFPKMDGVAACAYFRSDEEPVVYSLVVWESLGACYTWLLESDYRNTMLPYVSHLVCEGGGQKDVFKVVYVSSDEVLLDVKPLQLHAEG